MTEENRKDVSEQGPSEPPSDGRVAVEDVQQEVPAADLSAPESPEELSEREVFVGDEDFYNSLADSLNQPRFTGTGVGRFPLISVALKQFSAVQKILGAGIFVIALMLLYMLFRYSSINVTVVAPTAGGAEVSAVRPISYPESPQEAAQQVSQPEVASGPVQPLSLEAADGLYLQKDYEGAYAVYDRLYQGIANIPRETLLKDFLQLRKALCMKKSADADKAEQLFRTVTMSDSPALRATANYQLGLLEVQKKQYLKARTSAYRAIALIDAIDYDRNWVLSMRRNCHFLIAEAITRNILSLCDADKELPADLWGGDDEVPQSFTGISEAQLRSFLNSGREKLNKGLLGPQIEKPDGGNLPRWDAVCRGASVGELLARFSANAGFDIRWGFGGKQGSEPAADFAAYRAVSLYMSEVSPRQFVSVAAGCAGLLGSLDDKSETPTINVYNPDDYQSLSEHISLLSQEAVWLWQKFLLAFHDDAHLDKVHFIIGLLQAQRGRTTESLAEHKLAANHFTQSSVAPFALLHSSKIKAGMCDYFGARGDLKQLVEQYPDVEISSRACLYLAEVTMKASLAAEAARLYCKVYNLGLSSELQTVSAFGAGRCFYDEKDYEAAEKWLTKYIELAGDRTSRDVCLAFFLLGKTNLALGRPRQACEAFEGALAGQLSRESYIETISSLVETQMQQGLFIEALDVLEDVRPWHFSHREFAEIVLLKCKILRSIGLVDNAVAELGDRAEYVSDPQLKAQMLLELARCYISSGRLEWAHSSLAELLTFVGPGPLAHETALELANVCLKLGRDSQAVSVCSQLLELGPSEQIRQEASNILAAAYRRQKNYDKAAAVLLGQRERLETRR